MSVLGLLTSSAKEAVVLGLPTIVELGASWALLGQVVALRYLREISRSVVAHPGASAQHPMSHRRSQRLPVVSLWPTPAPPSVHAHGREGSAAGEHGPLSRGQLGPGFDPELLHQDGADPLEVAQGLCLAPLDVQDPGEQRPQALAEGMARAKGFELSD